MTVSRRVLAGSLALAALLAAAPARAFQIEWQAEPTRQGTARVAGYVRNDNLRSTTNVRMRVDRLAPDGRVLGSSWAWAPGILTSGDRVYFEVGLPEPAPSYRVTVQSFDWFRCGD